MVDDACEEKIRRSILDEVSTAFATFRGYFVHCRLKISRRWFQNVFVLL